MTDLGHSKEITIYEAGTSWVRSFRKKKQIFVCLCAPRPPPFVNNLNFGLALCSLPQQLPCHLPPIFFPLDHPPCIEVAEDDLQAYPWIDSC